MCNRKGTEYYTDFTTGLAYKLHFELKLIENVNICSVSWGTRLHFSENELAIEFS